jgi:hypothetical protein
MHYVMDGCWVYKISAANYRLMLLEIADCGTVEYLENYGKVVVRGVDNIDAIIRRQARRGKVPKGQRWGYQNAKNTAKWQKLYGGDATLGTAGDKRSKRTKADLA